VVEAWALMAGTVFLAQSLLQAEAAEATIWFREVGTVDQAAEVVVVPTTRRVRE